MTSQLESALVQALAAGDERAFNELVGRHHRSLVRLARTFVRTEAVAEERRSGLLVCRDRRHRPLRRALVAEDLAVLHLRAALAEAADALA